MPTIPANTRIELGHPDLITGCDIGDIQPMMLDRHLTLNGVYPPEKRGITATWTQWRDNLRQQAIKGWQEWIGTGDEGTQQQLDAYLVPRRLFATASLPMKVLDACHTMLFGSTTTEPSLGALTAISAALFPHRTNAGWLCDLYCEASRVHDRRQRQAARLDALLRVMEE